jgi:hypothetical protein
MAGRWRGTLGQTAGSPIRFHLDVVGRDEKRGGKLASLGSRQVQPVGARKKAVREAQQGKLTASLGTLWAHLLELIERHLRRQAYEEFR